MNYIGYDFSLNEKGIGLDEELNIDKLGWQEGDYFRLTMRNRHMVLVKLDPLEVFLDVGAKK